MRHILEVPALLCIHVFSDGRFTHISQGSLQGTRTIIQLLRFQNMARYIKLTHTELMI